MKSLKLFALGALMIAPAMLAEHNVDGEELLHVMVAIAEKKGVGKNVKCSWVGVDGWSSDNVTISMVCPRETAFSSAINPALDKFYDQKMAEVKAKQSIEEKEKQAALKAEAEKIEQVQGFVSALDKEKLQSKYATSSNYSSYIQEKDADVDVDRNKWRGTADYVFWAYTSVVKYAAIAKQLDEKEKAAELKKQEEEKAKAEKTAQVEAHEKAARK